MNTETQHYKKTLNGFKQISDNCEIVAKHLRQVEKSFAEAARKLLENERR